VEQVDGFIKTTVGEIERLLSSRTVVGEPVTVEGATIIPLLGVGFFFGAGGGSGKGESKRRAEGTGEGSGGGSSGAGGVKPIAVLIVDKSGVRVESIKGGFASAMEKIGESIPSMMQKASERKKEE